jgi:hypothetical protein
MLGLTPSRILIWIFIGALFYVGLQYVPVYFYALEFDDFVKDQVKYAPARKTTETTQLLQLIADEAKRDRMVLDPKRDIKVLKARDAARGVRTLAVDVDYMIPVDLYYFTHPVKFHVHAETVY